MSNNYASESNFTSPTINEIKEYVKQIAASASNTSALDADKKLTDDLEKTCYELFCRLKQQKKTFTICSNSKLARMRIPEDGFSDAETLEITGLIRGNLLDAFAELIANTYLPKENGSSISFLYFMELFSKYTGEKHAVYFCGRNKEVFIFTNELSEITLEDYISDYFSPHSRDYKEIDAIRATVFSEGSFANKQAKINETVSILNRKTIESHGFIRGAITFLDFLAWKGLWQKAEGDDSLYVVSKLIVSFREQLEALSSKMFEMDNEIPMSSLISISDTIAVFTPKTSRVKESDLIKMHAQFSKYVLEQCTKEQFPIRGAISFGEYSFMNNIMLGPGIDECASWHETGDWIGVHLSPSAELLLEEEEGKEFICSDYPIPLKQGLRVKYCVKWSISKNEFRDLAFKNRALLPEISGKYMNTRAFLEKTAWEGGMSDD